MFYCTHIHVYETPHVLAINNFYFIVFIVYPIFFLLIRNVDREFGCVFMKSCVKYMYIETNSY